MPRHAKKIRSYAELTEKMIALTQKVSGTALHQVGEIHSSAGNYPFFVLERPTAVSDKKRVCLSAGIHGDEPAGVEAVLFLIARFASVPAFFEKFDLCCFPCVNPFAYEFNLRENGKGKDLNREFNTRSPEDEIRLLKEAVSGKCFDLAYEFHEDCDAKGFYLYEVSREGHAIGEKIIEAIKTLCPVQDDEMIEEMPASNGVISASFSDPDFCDRLEEIGGWPQTIFFAKTGTPRCITAETPLNLEMAQRVNVHLRAFEKALSLL